MLLSNLDAGSLSHLRLIETEMTATSKEAAKTATIFDQEKDRISISPLRLELKAFLSQTTTLNLLKKFSRLNDLCLYWKSNFKWEGNFVNALLQKEMSSST
jgi:hypothetical protein